MIKIMAGDTGDRNKQMGKRGISVRKTASLLRRLTPRTSDEPREKETSRSQAREKPSRRNRRGKVPLQIEQPCIF